MKCYFEIIEPNSCVLDEVLFRNHWTQQMKCYFEIIELNSCVLDEGEDQCPILHNSIDGCWLETYLKRDIIDRDEWNSAKLIGNCRRYWD